MPSKSLPKKLFPFIWTGIKEYQSAVILYVILALAAGCWGPFNSLIVRHLINLLPHVATGGSAELFFPASLIVLNFIVFDNFTWRGLSYIKYKFFPFVLNKADNLLLEYTLRQSHHFFGERLSGTLAKQIFNLIDGIEKILYTSASHILRATSLLAMSFLFAYQVNSVFLLILVLWSLFFFSISLFMSKKLTHLSHDQAAKETVLGGEIIDSLTHSFSISIFAHRHHEITRRKASMVAYRKAYQKKEMYALIMHSIQGGLIALMMAFSTYFLVYLYGKGAVTIGDFALILGLSIETGHMIWHTMDEVDELNKTVGRCKQSLQSLSVPIEIVDQPRATALTCTQGKIIFDHVTFNYKGAELLFQNKSIEIGAGQKVGLVGYSGGGKSTFVNLILRLYDVTDGAILIDGQDIRNVTQDSLRENIAMIPQDPSLFHRSLMENIRYGRLGASDEEVIAAAQKARAHDFIEKLPKGYDTLVGERGVKLSGGQRQRIAIARAILKNAPILILDEATSQLDSVTETLIQESLLELMNSSAECHPRKNRGPGRDSHLRGNDKWGGGNDKGESGNDKGESGNDKWGGGNDKGESGNDKGESGNDKGESGNDKGESGNDKGESGNDKGGKTVLVIAHRLSTLLSMDRILVFDKGKIVEDGTHSELLAKAGLYKSLWDAQVGGFLGCEPKAGSDA